MMGALTTSPNDDISRVLARAPAGVALRRLDDGFAIRVGPRGPRWLPIGPLVWLTCLNIALLWGVGTAAWLDVLAMNGVGLVLVLVAARVSIGYLELGVSGNRDSYRAPGVRVDWLERGLCRTRRGSFDAAAIGSCEVRRVARSHQVVVATRGSRSPRHLGVAMSKEQAQFVAMVLAELRGDPERSVRTTTSAELK